MFPDAINDNINKHDIFLIMGVISQHLGVLHNSVHQQFPNDQCMMLQMMHGEKIHSKDPVL